MLTEIASTYTTQPPVKSRKRFLIIVVINANIMHFPFDISQMTNVTSTINQQMQEKLFDIYDM